MLSEQLSVDRLLTADQDIWEFAAHNDFDAVIARLRQYSCPDEDLGEVLLAFARTAIARQQFGTARNILEFLVASLEDQAEVPPLIKLIGDIHAGEGNYGKAREYYGRLPLTVESAAHYLQTFVPGREVDGLLSTRDRFLAGLPEADRPQVHAVVDQLLTGIAADPQIRRELQARWEQNRQALPLIDPALSAHPDFQQPPPAPGDGSGNPACFRLADRVYLRQNGVWGVAAPAEATSLTREELGFRKNVFIRCPSLASLMAVVAILASGPKREFYKSECLLIMEWQTLIQAMAGCDLTPLASCDFVIRFLDEKNPGPYLRHLLLEKKIFFPAILIDLARQKSGYYERYIRPTLAECEKIILEDIAEYEKQLVSLYPDDFHDAVVRKIAEKRKLKILLKTSRYTTYLQYSTRDMAEGFRQLGHEVFMEMEEEHAGASLREDVKLQNLCVFQPDIIFGIDHFRFEEPAFPKGVPYITWVQDILPNMQRLTNPGLLTPADFIFSFSSWWIEGYFKNHAVFKRKEIALLPIMANTNVYYPLTGFEKKYDVSFVTHLPDISNTYFQLTDGYGMPDVHNVRKFIRRLVVYLNGCNVAELYALILDLEERKRLVISLCEELGITVEEEMMKLVEVWGENGTSRLFDHFMLLIKMKPIEHLLANGIKVYVFGSNWDKIPRLRDIAKGPVQNGRDLNELYNSSCINLNMSPGTTYHMKAGEVIATSNFMLTRKIDKGKDAMPIESLFEVGEEVVMFEDEADLLAKVRFYLGHPEKRERIAQAAYRKMVANYTVDKGAGHVLTVIANS